MKRLLATSLFAAGAYSLTLLAGTPGASADGPVGVVTPSSAVLSPATAAIADGDDIRARFIFETTANNRLSAATETTAAPYVAALSPASAALADGDDIRARFTFETTK